TYFSSKSSIRPLARGLVRRTPPALDGLHVTRLHLGPERLDHLIDRLRAEVLVLPLLARPHRDLPGGRFLVSDDEQVGDLLDRPLVHLRAARVVAEVA